MRRRYDRDYSCPRTRPNWFILFFIMVAIFFFNYFGRKLSQTSLKIAYNFSFKDVREGKLYTLNNFRGKYLIIAFVILDCEPCIWQIKELERLQKSFRDLKTLVIFLDSDVYLVKKYIKRERLSIPVYVVLPSELNSIVSKYGIKKVPFLIITDKLGRIKRFYDEPVTSSELKDVIKVIKRYGI